MIITINEYKKSILMKFMGQCDTLRRMSKQNDMLWHDMMKKKRKITFDKFIDSVDYTNLLDDDGEENIYDYLKDSLLTDRSTAVYKSYWGDEPVIFLQSAGFEFIYI